MSETNFSPREIVSELDRNIVGQNDAKRAVAVALRNRWRRQQLSPELRRFTNSAYIGSHSLRQEILKLIGGQIYTSNALDQGLLVNAAGGHYELTLAQDFTLGYEHHDADTVTLFLMEAFTFRVLNPEASLSLKVG